MSAEQSGPARIDVVVDRDPDGDTGVKVFIDGLEVEIDEASGIAVHVIDPGRSGADDEWKVSMFTHSDATPPAVREAIESTAREYF
ncbi:hypothetical protein [Actinacidiphila glaucinigra]|uniref:hypothetical protein n=1 Tax=Actinacidiphila glaucinigra TaxID=235986 RepID=UPI00366C9842